MKIDFFYYPKKRKYYSGPDLRGNPFCFGERQNKKIVTESGWNLWKRK